MYTNQSHATYKQDATANQAGAYCACSSLCIILDAIVMASIIILPLAVRLQLQLGRT